MKVLVTGGTRSGKSAYAEELLRDRSAIYVATGAVPTSDDPCWAERVAEHRARRPASWDTFETSDVEDALSESHGRPLLVDSVGSWVAAQLDSLGAWESASNDWREVYAQRVAGFVAAVAAADDVILVSEEVGLSLVSEHASGRLYTDLLGKLNQLIAAQCDRVVLVVAGCPLTIKA